MTSTPQSLELHNNKNFKFLSIVVGTKIKYLDQRGAIASEYALLAVLIAVAIVSGVTALGEGVLGLFSRLLDQWP